jgi:predicted AAA+ superfamily ATPase
MEYETSAAYHLTLEQNVHMTLEADLTAIYPELTGRTLQKIKQLLALIAQQVPFTPNWQKLCRLLDVGDARTLKTYFQYLEKAGLITMLAKPSSKLSVLEDIGKIYLSNTNLLHAISAGEPNSGTVREIFFQSMLCKDHAVHCPKTGDFLIDHQYCFEVGGRNKDLKQIHDQPSAYIAADNIEAGSGRKIPLWLFGMLY